jgi:hypothetical protein
MPTWARAGSWASWCSSIPERARRPGYNRWLAVAVAQLVESRIVIPVVVGSSPISHPSLHLHIRAGCSRPFGAFRFCAGSSSQALPARPPSGPPNGLTQRCPCLIDLTAPCVCRHDPLDDRVAAGQVRAMERGWSRLRRKQGSRPVGTEGLPGWSRSTQGAECHHRQASFSAARLRAGAHRVLR